MILRRAQLEAEAGLAAAAPLASAPGAGMVEDDEEEEEIFLDPFVNDPVMNILEPEAAP